MKQPCECGKGWIYSTFRVLLCKLCQRRLSSPPPVPVHNTTGAGSSWRPNSPGKGGACFTRSEAQTAGMKKIRGVA